jgi:hypothetical protein
MVLLQREMQKVVGLLHFVPTSGKESGPRARWGSANRRFLAGFDSFSLTRNFICKAARQ